MEHPFHGFNESLFFPSCAPHQLRLELNLYEIEDAGGHRAGILSGMVTEHMPVLKDYLDTTLEKTRGAGGLEIQIARKHREYINFTGWQGELISGLRLRPGQIHPMAKAFGKMISYEHTPESAYSDILAGDSVPRDLIIKCEGPYWGALTLAYCR